MITYQAHLLALPPPAGPPGDEAWLAGSADPAELDWQIRLNFNIRYQVDRPGMMQLSTTLRRSCSNVRVYSNLFLLSNASWTLSASLMPPTHDKPSFKIKYPASLLLSAVQTSMRYQKGGKPECYFLRGREMLALGCWDPKHGPFEYVHQSKAVLLSAYPREDNKSGALRLIIFDRELPDSQRRKEFSASGGQFQLLQGLIKAATEHSWGVRTSQMSAARPIVAQLVDYD